MIETPDLYAKAYPAEDFVEDGFMRSDSAGFRDMFDRYRIWIYHIEEKYGADFNRKRASYSLLQDDTFETVVALFKYRPK